MALGSPRRSNDSHRYRASMGCSTCGLFIGSAACKVPAKKNLASPPDYRFYCYISCFVGLLFPIIHCPEFDWRLPLLRRNVQRGDSSEYVIKSIVFHPHFLVDARFVAMG